MRVAIFSFSWFSFHPRAFIPILLAISSRVRSRCIARRFARLPRPFFALFFPSLPFLSSRLNIHRLPRFLPLHYLCAPSFAFSFNLPFCVRVSPFVCFPIPSTVTLFQCVRAILILLTFFWPRAIDPCRLYHFIRYSAVGAGDLRCSSLASSSSLIMGFGLASRTLSRCAALQIWDFGFGIMRKVMGREDWNLTFARVSRSTRRRAFFVVATFSIQSSFSLLYFRDLFPSLKWLTLLSHSPQNPARAPRDPARRALLRPDRVPHVRLRAALSVVVHADPRAADDAERGRV